MIYKMLPKFVLLFSAVLAVGAASAQEQPELPKPTVKATSEQTKNFATGLQYTEWMAVNCPLSANLQQQAKVLVRLALDSYTSMLIVDDRDMEAGYKKGVSEAKKVLDSSKRKEACEKTEVDILAAQRQVDKITSTK